MVIFGVSSYKGRFYFNFRNSHIILPPDLAPALGVSTTRRYKNQ